MFYLELFAITLLVIYYRDLFFYWNKRKLISYPARNPITGSIQSRNLLEENKKFYNHFKSHGAKHGGFIFYHTPIYMPVDPLLIKQIFTKDFEHFTSKGLYNDPQQQPINDHLFLASGHRWRQLRTKLSPLFSSSKLKTITPVIVACTQNMINHVQECATTGTCFDAKVVAGKFITDVIGNCAYGIDCNSFKDPKCEFKSHADEITLCPLRFKVVCFLGLNFPRLLKFLRIDLIPKKVEDFYTRIAMETLRYREENRVVRQDLFQVLLDMKHKEKIEERLSVQELIAQTFVFFVAGFETSSSTITFTLFELANNHTIQEKLRNEVIGVMDKGELDYDSVNGMQYMNQVVEETLRKYPPVNLINRECTKEYHVPDTDVVLNKGTKVFVPIYAIQNDPDYFPDPQMYDPDRFSAENRRTIKPFTYMPFGEGPRFCTGARFGQLQVKICLATLLRKFRFSLHPSVEYPAKMAPTFVSLATRQRLLIRSTPL